MAQRDFLNPSFKCKPIPSLKMYQRIPTCRLRHDAAHVYTSVISCVVKCKKWVGQQPRWDQVCWLEVWLALKPGATSRPSLIPTLPHSSSHDSRPGNVLFSSQPVQSFRRREQEIDSVLWIYVLCLSEATALSVLWLVWNIFAYCAPVLPLFSSLFCQGFDVDT